MWMHNWSWNVYFGICFVYEVFDCYIVYNVFLLLVPTLSMLFMHCNLHEWALQRYLLYCSWFFLVCGYHTYILKSVNGLVLVWASFFSLSCKRCPFCFWLFDQHDARGRGSFDFLFKLHEMTLFGKKKNREKIYINKYISSIDVRLWITNICFTIFWVDEFDAKTCKFKCGGEKTK